MAVAFKERIGESAGTSICSIAQSGGTVVAGDFLVIWCACDNTAGTNLPDVSAVLIGTVAQTFTQLVAHDSASTSAAGATRGFIVIVPSASGATGLIEVQFTVTPAKTVAVAATFTGVSSVVTSGPTEMASTTGSMSVGSTHPLGELELGLVSCENNAAMTADPTASYVNTLPGGDGTSFTSGGGAAANVSLLAVYRIETTANAARFVGASAGFANDGGVAYVGLSPLTIPATPSITNLSTSQTGARSVEVAYSADAMASSWTIERSPNGSTGWTTLKSGHVGYPNNAFYDTTALPSTTYWYRVSAVNSLGSSAPSTAQSITTPAAVTYKRPIEGGVSGSNFSPGTLDSGAEHTWSYGSAGSPTQTYDSSANAVHGTGGSTVGLKVGVTTSDRIWYFPHASYGGNWLRPKHWWFRGYANAASGTTGTWLRFIGTGGAADTVGLFYDEGSAMFHIRQGSSGTIYASSTQVYGSEVRIEAEHAFDGKDLTVTVRLFKNVNLDGNTPDDTLGPVVVSSAVADVSSGMEWGYQRWLASAGQCWWDDIAVSTAGWVGPLVLGPQTLPIGGTLAVTASLSAGLRYSTTAGGSLAVTATLAATAGKAVTAQANPLAVTATLGAAAVPSKPVTGALAATATITAGLGGVSRPVTGTLPVTATLTATAVETNRVQGALAVTATLTAAGGAPERTVTGALTATATLSADADVAAGAVTHLVDGSLAVVASLGAAVLPSRVVGGALAATATLSATATPTRTVGGSLAATATLGAAALPTHLVAGGLAVTATLTATALPNRAVDGSLAALATLSAAPAVTHPFDGSLAVTATLGAAAAVTAANVIPVTATLVVTATRTATAGATHPVGGSLVAFASITAGPVITARVGGALVTTASLAGTLGATRTIAGARTITATLTSTALATRRVTPGALVITADRTAAIAVGPASLPVKWWTGSAYVTKPAKRWNGSAWVPAVIKEPAGS